MYFSLPFPGVILMMAPCMTSIMTSQCKQRSTHYYISDSILQGFNFWLCYKLEGMGKMTVYLASPVHSWSSLSSPSFFFWKEIPQWWTISSANNHRMPLWSCLSVFVFFLLGKTEWFRHIWQDHYTEMVMPGFQLHFWIMLTFCSHTTYGSPYVDRQVSGNLFVSRS